MSIPHVPDGVLNEHPIRSDYTDPRSLRERVTSAASTHVTNTHVPEHTEHAQLPRVDYGTAMADLDVERARGIAVRLEQELALAEDELSEAGAALVTAQHRIAFLEAQNVILHVIARRRRGRRLRAWLRQAVTW